MKLKPLNPRIVRDIQFTLRIILIILAVTGLLVLMNEFAEQAVIYNTKTQRHAH